MTSPCSRCAQKSRWIEGAPAGAADLTGIHGGKRVEIEVKTEIGRPSAEQKLWAEMIRSKGGIYILARSADEFIDGFGAHMGLTP